MDTLIKLIQAIAPLVTVGLAVFGLFVWYWQLVAKRKFEIAEQAVTVWRRANDALSYVRDPFVHRSEGDSIKIDEKITGKKRENAERHRYIYERLNNIADAFKDVRLTQILVDLHINSEAARAFDVLFRVRHHIRVDADMLIDDYDEYFATPEAMIEYQERRKDYRRAITERRNREDDYSWTLDEAGQVLEVECKQILRPKTLREFLFSKAIKATAHDWSEEAKKVLGRRAPSLPPPEQPR
jgi:hypothetical protein